MHRAQRGALPFSGTGPGALLPDVPARFHFWGGRRGAHGMAAFATYGGDIYWLFWLSGDPCDVLTLPALCGGGESLALLGELRFAEAVALPAGADDGLGEVLVPGGDGGGVRLPGGVDDGLGAVGAVGGICAGGGGVWLWAAPLVLRPVHQFCLPVQPCA